MHTIAQFSIKDSDATDSQTTEAPLPRNSGTSFRNGSVRGGSSLKHVESSSGIAGMQGIAGTQEIDYAPLPTGISEMPAMDNLSIMESPPLEEHQTPTGLEAQLRLDHPRPYSPIEMPGDFYFEHLDHHEEKSHAQRDLQPPPRYGVNSYMSNLPAVDGRASMLLDDVDYLPPRSSLRIMNRSPELDEEEWSPQAVMHMNLAGEPKSRGTDG